MCERFYIETPCVESACLARLAGVGKVVMKLETLQPSGSFKLRGTSHLICKEVQRGKRKLVCSSGGNSGLAVAHVARKMGLPLCIYVPSTTKPMLVRRLKDQGAEVVVHGDVWDEADSRCREAALENGVAYIPPFDHPHLWEGHATMMEEAVKQVADRPDVVVVSVGGGGLLMGVVEGMENVGWGHVPVLAVETEGAASFHKALLAGRVVPLERIESIATSLGALKVAEEALEVSKRRPVVSALVSDKECVQAMSLMLDEHRMLLEPACAASVAVLTSGTFQRLQEQGKLPPTTSCVLVVLCGGSAVNHELFLSWKNTFNL